MNMRKNKWEYQNQAVEKYNLNLVQKIYLDTTYIIICCNWKNNAKKEKKVLTNAV